MLRPLAHLVVPFLWLQAAAVAAWWLVLWFWPASRPLFVIADWPHATLFAFALPDSLAIVSGSAGVAWGLRRRRSWARPLLAAVTGAVLYATLWCLGALVATGSGWLSAALMLASAGGTTLALFASRPCD